MMATAYVGLELYFLNVLLATTAYFLDEIFQRFHQSIQQLLCVVFNL